VSAVAVDALFGLLWMTDWVEGRYVYAYDLKTGKYVGRMRLRPVPDAQQGIAARKGLLFITADDGDADGDANGIPQHDNLWSVEISGFTYEGRFYALPAIVNHEKRFKEFRRRGEIEGLDFDPRTGELVVLNNRGKRIVRGMPKGLYPGYDREIHELYVYRIR